MYIKFDFLINANISKVTPAIKILTLITVSGETIEVAVERIYSPGADYPRSALRKGTEGFVVVEFDVSPDGEVVDPYIVETDQPGSFERSVMRTIRRWAYEPYVHNGVPVTVNDVKARFTFKLTN